MKTRTLTLVSTLALIGASSGTLTACNSSEAAKKQIESDWVHDTGPQDSTGGGINPTPDPSPTLPPTPTPTPPVPTPSPSTPTPPTPELYSGETSFAPYVQKFVDDASNQGISLTQEMKSDPVEIVRASLDYLGSGVIGLCETGYGGRKVTLDPDFWDVVSETQKELLMHHELGHCILYRPHRSTFLSSGKEASIMYPIIMSSSTYLNNASYYLNELFTWAANQAEVRTASNLRETTQPEPTTHICDVNSN